MKTIFSLEQDCYVQQDCYSLLFSSRPQVLFLKISRLVPQEFTAPIASVQTSISVPNNGQCLNSNLFWITRARKYEDIFSILENGECQNFGLYIGGYHMEHIQLFPCSAMKFSLWICLIFRALFIGEIWRISGINKVFRTCETKYRPLGIWISVCRIHIFF